MKSQNHKLNRAVQAMLFSMVESGMQDELIGDKGKLRAKANGPGPTGDTTSHNGSEAMWAVILTKELWRKGIWCARLLRIVDAFMADWISRNDAKTVSIVSLGCFHPVMKVQSASIHFFLGGDEENQDIDDEGPEVERIVVDICPSDSFTSSGNQCQGRPASP